MIINSGWKIGSKLQGWIELLKQLCKVKIKSWEWLKINKFRWLSLLKEVVDNKWLRIPLKIRRVNLLHLLKIKKANIPRLRGVEVNKWLRTLSKIRKHRWLHPKKTCRSKISNQTKVKGNKCQTLPSITTELKLIQKKYMRQMRCIENNFLKTQKIRKIHSWVLWKKIC
jgi:hypothetical protein